MKKIGKRELLTAVQALLQNAKVGTQEEICDALRESGWDVNQTKISRLLHQIGAVKMIENGRTVYRLPSELKPVNLSHSLEQLIVSIESNETLIVIRTTLGSAQLVAAMLDRQKQIGILGTVAGDDTIFIAPKTQKDIPQLKQKISKILLD